MWERKQESPANTPSPSPAENWAAKPETKDLGAGQGQGPQARLGPSLKVKGEISGSEDLYIDGEVEGSIELKKGRLIVGPKAKVRAEVTVSSITIQGHLQGKVLAEEKAEIRQSGSLEGDLVTARIVVEEGAVFRGSIDIVRPAPGQNDSKPGPKPAALKPAATVTEREKAPVAQVNRPA